MQRGLIQGGRLQQADPLFQLSVFGLGDVKLFQDLLLRELVPDVLNGFRPLLERNDEVVIMLARAGAIFELLPRGAVRRRCIARA